MISEELVRELTLTLMKTQTAFRQAVQRNLKHHKIDITFEMLQIMTNLWRKDGINQQELALATLKDKATLTSLLNNLELRMLIARKEGSVDRRNRIISLTPKGIELGQQMRPILDETYKSASKNLSQKQTLATIEYLQKLSDVYSNTLLFDKNMGSNF